jgi:CDP-paratose 2-epimerase
VRDYARMYGTKTVVFRQSCIYGPRQFGIEDQGWVAWFVISAVMGRSINIYGDGKQVRDVLHVADLIDAYELAVEQRAAMNGRIFNVGGGAAHTLSILGLVHRLERLCGSPIGLRRFDWRPGDQPVYVSDIRKAERELGWKPKIDPDNGVKQLFEWVSANQNLIEEQLGDMLAPESAGR